MSADDFLCARCARHQVTCCQRRDIYVTPGDVQRIGQHTGFADFTELRAPDDPHYLDQDDDPVWSEHVFQPDGRRRVLKRQPNDDCVFLTDQGCRLPLETRPLVCRLYPFDYDADGLHEAPAPGCPLELLRPGQELLPTLNMEETAALRWHRQLYAEIRLEYGPATCTSD